MPDRAADRALVEAARFERDRRITLAPAAIRGGGDEEAISIDCQCWVAIAEWLETDRFASFAGGANPDRDDAPIIRWPEIEAAAGEAVVKVTSRLDSLEADPGAAPEALGQLRARRSSLVVIHRMLTLRRASIDAINAHFREREQGLAA